MRSLSLPCLLLALSACLLTVPAADRPVKEGRHTISLDGHTFSLPTGFVIESAVKPGLIDRPITVAMDEQGRLYVADSSGSNAKVADQLRDRPHRIVRLEDTDGDGVYDRAVVFADRMMFPEGTLWHQGSLYVAAPPSIWKLTDTNGDGVADQRVEWFEGKTLTGCANDLHGPYLGRDGRIYWCKGAFAKQTYKRPGKPDFVTRASHIFRSRVDGSDIEPVMTGGMDNPVGLAITPEGERIFSTTFFQHPAGGQRDGLIHAIPGAIYGKDHSVIYDPAHKWTHPALMPVLTHMGPAAPAGMCVYKSTAFGKEYENNLFASQFNLQKVSRHVLTPTGSTFTSRDEDFVVSDNRDFHPTDVFPDADGSLLVINTGGWYKLCCPSSQLVKPDIKGAIYRVRRKNAPVVADPRGVKLAWDKLTPPKLISLLDDARPFVRRRAVQTLARHATKAVEPLKSTVESSKSSLARLNAVWAATQIDTPDARAVVRLATQDGDSAVRHAALHSISLRRDKEATEQLVKLLGHESMHTRRLAAECLGRLEAKRAIPALFATIKTPTDRGLEHAIIYALIEIADRSATEKYLTNDDPRCRRAALIALDQMENGKLVASTVTKELTAKEPALQEAAWWIAGKHPDWGGDMADYFRVRLRETATPAAQEDLVRQLGRFAGGMIIQKMLSDRLFANDSTSQEKSLILRVMAGSGVKPVPASWREALLKTLMSNDADLLTGAIDTIRVLPLTRKDAGKIADRLLTLGADVKQPVGVRLRALAAVPGGPGALQGEIFDLVRGKLDREQAVILRNLSAEILSRAKLTGAQFAVLTEMLDRVGPMELERVLEAYASTTDETVGIKLIEALEVSSVRSTLRIDSVRNRLAKYSRKVQQRAEKLYAELHRDHLMEQAQLEKLLASLGTGDVRRGQAVFNSEKASCSACHAIGYLGGKIGPDLTRIGKIRNKRDLLEAILYPSASFVRSYEPVMVTTTQGKVHNGLIKRESPTEIEMITSAKEQVRISRTAIEEIQPSKVSVMPAGIEKILTRQELADLVAFLQGCQ